MGLHLGEGVRVLVEGLKSGWDGVLFSAPPGYGESFSRLVNSVTRELGLSRFLYIVPVGGVVEGVFEEIGSGQVGGIGGSLFWGEEFVVSGLDWFLICLHRGCPINNPEFREVIRAHLFSSFIYFNEPHLGIYGGPPFYSGAVLATYSLYRLGVPFVYRSGTLPSSFIEDFLDTVSGGGGEGVIVDVIPPCSECRGRRQSLFTRYSIKYISVEDREFFEQATEVGWRYNISKRETLDREITDALESGYRAVRVVERIGDAVSEYENFIRVLGEEKIGLIHEWLTPSDRRVVFEKLSRGSIDLLVATPCIESSPSIREFNYLYTDVPLKYTAGIVPRIDSIIVRTGFIGGEDSETGNIVFVEDIDYPELHREVYDLFTRRGPVNPRLPLMDREKYKDWIGYLWLLDKYYLEHLPVSSIERFQRDIIRVFTSVSSGEFFEDICGLLGYSYVPVLPNPDDLGISWDSLLDGISDYVISIDYRVLRRRLKWFLGDGGFVDVVFWDEKGDLFIDSVELDRVSNWLSSCSSLRELFYRYKVQALVLRRDLYRVEKGFV